MLSSLRLRFRQVSWQHGRPSGVETGRWCLVDGEMGDMPMIAVLFTVFIPKP